MNIMKSPLFITALLCLLTAAVSAQTSTMSLDASVQSLSMPVDAPAAEQAHFGPAGGPSIAWHNFRQHRSANDIAPGLVVTWDLPLARPTEDLVLSARPGMSYLHPTVLIDAVLRLQYRDLCAVVAGFSLDPTGDREFRFEESHPDWIWKNEHDSFGKRSFAVLGLQIPTGFAYYEFLYRIQLEKGSHAYYTDPDRTFTTPAGYRRYFILSVGMGIWLR